MNFGDIPAKDIKYLLSNQLLSNNIYLQAWNFIISNPNIKVPKSIAEWINIYNMQNKFKDLPDEVVAKILSELDYKHLSLTCSLSRQFNSICNEYLIPLIKGGLGEKGYYVKNINNIKWLTNISRIIELNKRTIKLNGKDYVIDPNGNVKIITYADNFSNKSSDEYLIFETENITDASNIVGLSDYLDGKVLAFLRNDGKVIIYNIYKQTTKLLDKYENIVQVVYFKSYFYFLDLNDKVFKCSFLDLYRKTNKSILVMENISKIVVNVFQILFLSNNGEIYNETTKLFQGIKELDTQKHIFFILKDDNDLYMIGDNIYPNKIFGNVKKFYYDVDYLLILTKSGNLYITNNKEPPIEIEENVVDITQNLPLLVKTSSNELYYLKIFGADPMENHKSQQINIKGEMILLGNGFILMDGNIYKYVKNNVVIKILPTNENITTFKDLPDDVILKMMNDLDCEELISFCESSKQFEYVCNNNIITLLKDKVSKKGLSVENINSKAKLVNICRVPNLMNKIATWEWRSDIKDFIIGPNGKVYSVDYYSDSESDDSESDDSESDDVNVDISILDVENVIGIVQHYEFMLLLRHDGKVYGYNHKPELLYESDDTTMNNVIQIVFCESIAYFLKTNGEVYKWSINENGYPVFVMDNIKSMSSNSTIVMLLRYDGDVYEIKNKIGGQYPTQIFRKVKSIYIFNGVTFCISEDDILYKISNESSDIISAPNDIIKLSFKRQLLFMLTSSRKLYIHVFDNEYNSYFDDPIQLSLSEIVDFTDILIVTSDSKLFQLETKLDNEFSYEIKELHVNGKVKLIGKEYIAVDNVIYRLSGEDLIKIDVKEIILDENDVGDLY
jgi:hypothetical protein